MTLGTGQFLLLLLFCLTSGGADLGQHRHFRSSVPASESSVGVNLRLTSPSACSQNVSRDADQCPAAWGAHKLSKEPDWSHTSCRTDLGLLCIEPEGLACHPVSKQTKPGWRQSASAIPGLQGTCGTRNRMQDFSPGGGHTETQGNYQSSPPPCQQAHCPHSGAQGHQCLSGSWFPQGPVARPAQCSKAKEVLSDSSMAQGMDPRPAAALCGQGSEPVPGTSSLARRHCHNYPAIPFKCTATIATDRCSVPATVHSKAGAKHKT